MIKTIVQMKLEELEEQFGGEIDDIVSVIVRALSESREDRDARMNKWARCKISREDLINSLGPEGRRDYEARVIKFRAIVAALAAQWADYEKLIAKNREMYE